MPASSLQEGDIRRLRRDFDLAKAVCPRARWGLARHHVVEQELRKPVAGDFCDVENPDTRLAGIEGADLQGDALGDHAVPVEGEQVDLQRAKGLALAVV